MKSGLKIFIFLLTTALLFESNVYGATYYTRASGNWNSNATWSLTSGGNAVAAGVFPVAGDFVIMENGYDVTVTANAACASITVKITNNNTNLTVNSGINLSVSGDFKYESDPAANHANALTGPGSISCNNFYLGSTVDVSPSSNATMTVTFTTATLTVANNMIFYGWKGTNRLSNSTLTFTSGTINVGGQIYALSEVGDNTATLTMGNTNPTLNLSGANPWGTSTGTFTRTLTGTGATVNYNGTSPQSILGTTYRNLKVNNAIGAALNAAATVTALTIGDVTANSIFDDAGFSISTATTLTITSGTYLCGAASFPWGTATIGGTVDYDRAGIQTVAAKTYNNLTLSGSGNKTITTTTTVNGTLSLQGTAAAITGTLRFGASGILEYKGSGSQTSTNIEFPSTNGPATLMVNNSNGVTLHAARTVANITIGDEVSNSVLNDGGFQLTSTGILNLTSGTFKLGSTTTGTSFPAFSTVNIASGTIVEYASNQSQTIAAQNYANLTSSGNGSRTLASSGTIGVAQVFTNGTNTYTVTGSTVSFNGTGSQNIPAFTFNNLSTATGGTKTLTGTVTVNTVVAVGASSTLDLSSQTLTLAGSGTPLVINGTFTASTSTINFTSTSATNIAGATYNNINLSGSNTKTAQGAISVNGLLTIASGVTFDLGTNTLSGATLTTSGTGILKTSNTGNTPIPSGRNWTMDVQFVASSNQNVPAGTYSKTLSIQGSNTAKLMNGNITVNTLDLTSGSIVLNDINGTPYTLTVTSQIIRAISGGTIDGVNDGVLEFANNAALLDIPQGTFGVGGINNMKISGGRTVRLASDYNGNLSLETLTTTGAGSYFDMNGYTLTITNSVSMSSGNGITGSLKGGSAPITGSSLIIGGVANQANIGTLYFDQTTPDVTNSFYNLTIGTTGGGSVTLGNKMNIRNTLQPPTSGTFTFNADSNLVIASRSTYTGRIAQINSGFSFGGKVIVERYVKNKTARRYIFLASPVDGISIRNGWQDDIFITSPASGGTACATDSTNGIPNKYNTNGYDATTRKLVTIFTYNQADKKWDSVITKSDSTYLQKGVGYRVYYRGSRGLNDANCSTMLESNSPIAPDSTIIDVDGTPTSGNVTVGVYGKGSNATYGYTLVGNPYPSELNFEVFQSDPSNSSIVSPTYWTHDPQSSSTTGYLSYNNNSVAGGASKTSGVITGANGKYIASGQAFFVQSALSGNANAGSITFKETHKSSSQQLGVFRNANTPLTWESRIRIGFLEADSTAVDDVLVRFSDEASVTKAPSDFWDAPTLNATKYLGTIKSNRTFAIQTRPKNFVNDTVMVRIVSNTTGNHILSFSEFDDFTEAAQIILIDQFTGIKTDVRANKYYPFTITNSAASQGGRFLLVFRSKESVMPVSFMNISATQKQEGVEVSWKVAYEQNVQDYSVERSDNGRDFKVIATVLSKGNSNAPVAYTYIDLQPLNGKGYYRVKSNEKSGETKYTAVVMVNSSKETLISVYPNPAKDNLQVQVSNPEMYKRVTILVRNAQGKTVIQQTAATVNGKVSINVSSLATGMYVISIINDKGESLMDKFVKQ